MQAQLTLSSGGGRDVFLAIERADLAESTKRQYTKALGNYLQSGASLTNADSLADYAAVQPESTRAFLKSAIRLWASGVAVDLKGGATPENVGKVQAALYRLEAIEAAISVRQSKGVKAHKWLSAAQVRALMNTCESDTLGKRDAVVLGLLLGAGLRRSEAVELTLADVKVQPVKERTRTVLAVKGKGAKDRVVPISEALGDALRSWGELVGGGRICRRITKRKGIGASLSAAGLFEIVRKRGAMIAEPDLAPHDCRRTFAQLAHDAGVPITQISRLLGHANVGTTQRYLNLDLDLEITASDFVPLAFPL